MKNYMDRIILTEEFYEDEIREGFYIPACVKQAWGAQIRVLNDVDKVCSELGIKYFADWGTFLGAVRHGGFIPWDDDFDICMLRDDYNRFLKEGVERLPEGYAVFNLKNKEDHEQFVANIVSRTRICFDADHLERFHGFPYISAVDVFLIDYMANDKDRQEAMKLKAQYALKISDEIREGKLAEGELKGRLQEAERLLDIRIPKGLTDKQIRQFLDIEAEKLFATFVDERNDAERIVQMMPWGLKDVKIMPASYYSETIDIPFETGTIPVPLIYDDALRRHYGDYMQLYKNVGGHDYPFFEKSRAQLQEVLDFELPEYKVEGEELLRKAEERKDYVGSVYGRNKYRDTVNDCLSEMDRLFDTIGAIMHRNRSFMGIQDDKDSTGIFNVGNNDIGDQIGLIADLCTDFQQLAIDLGTYMETVKGEGYDIVTLLEKLCEEIYLLTLDGMPDRLAEKYKEISNCLNGIKRKTERRREILFLPFKDSYWKTMEPLYKQAMCDPDTDVYVIPIPYYYKDYKGQLINMQYRVDEYPEDIELTHYDRYDYALHHPDIIVIQSPYDNYNDEMSVPPFFYSDKLLEITDRLIYIPWFETYDFTRENEREYINMKYYCTMPGVINADMVVLKSEMLRNTYIEKLCDFAGEITRGLWKRKIVVGGSEEASEMMGFGSYEGSEEAEGLKDSGGIDTTRKVLLYYPDFSDILQRGQQAIDKIKEVIDTFVENSEALDYLILKGRLIEGRLKVLNPSLHNEYIKVIETAVNKVPDSFEFVNEDETNYDTLVQRCSAFYGDGGHLAHMFRNAGKPVMIQNYDII